ncbi:hypothetical protein Tco_1280284 [Tanacetum coccineum]
MVPRTVLTRSGPISVNTVQSRTIMNNAGPMKNVINNAYSTAKRPSNKITAANNSNFTKKVNTVKGIRVNTARPKAVLSARPRKTIHNYEEIDEGYAAFGGTKGCNDACKARMETVRGKDYILLPIWSVDSLFSQDLKSSPDARFKPSGEEEKKDDEDPGNESGNPTKGKDSEVPSTEEPRTNQVKLDNINNTNNINTASDGNNTNNVNAVSSTVNAAAHN